MVTLFVRTDAAGEDNEKFLPLGEKGDFLVDRNRRAGFLVQVAAEHPAKSNRRKQQFKATLALPISNIVFATFCILNTA